MQGRGAPDTPCRNPCASRTAGGRTTRRRSKAPACAAPALQRVAAGRRCAPAPARLTPAAGRTRRAWRGRALMRCATPPKALRRRRSTASPAPRQAPRRREERGPLVLRAGVGATDNRHSGYAVRTAGEGGGLGHSGVHGMLLAYAVLQAGLTPAAGGPIVAACTLGAAPSQDAALSAPAFGRPARGAAPRLGLPGFPGSPGFLPFPGPDGIFDGSGLGAAGCAVILPPS